MILIFRYWFTDSFFICAELSAATRHHPNIAVDTSTSPLLPLPDEVLTKLADDVDRPTSLWCINSGFFTCMSHATSQPQDTCKEFRYVCSVCVKEHPLGQSTWKAGLKQANLVLKHASSKKHFDAFLKNYPLSDDVKRTRVINAIPALRAMMIKLSSNENKTAHFNESHLQSLAIKVMSNPTLAYWEAYCYGLGPLNGKRGKRDSISAPPKGRPQPNLFSPTFQQPTCHDPSQPSHMAPVPKPPESTPVAMRDHQPMPVYMKPIEPPLRLNSDLAQMYQVASNRSSQFMEKQNKSA